MAGNHIEQVTPRIPLNDCNNRSRTWCQPRIRLHSSIPSTQPLEKPLILSPLPECSKNGLHQLSLQKSPDQSLGAVSRQFRTARVRVLAPTDHASDAVSDVLRTTPVTHSVVPKPLKFRIAGAQLKEDIVCRRLFPNTTPTKRPRQGAPSFRFSCGRQRTQPEFGLRSGDHLIQALDVEIDEAERNVLIFRNALSKVNTDSSLRTAVKEGLLFLISRTQDNLFILRRFDQHHTQARIEVAVVITDEMYSKEVREEQICNYSGNVMYIPHPWHAQIVEGCDQCCSRVLIAAHKVDILPRDCLKVLECLTINSGLEKLKLFQATGAHCQGSSNGGPEPGFRFTSLSPHVNVVTLSVFVDFFEPRRSLAVIRDDAGEFAVLSTKNLMLDVSPRRCLLQNVSILSRRVPSQVILNVIGHRIDAALYEKLAVFGDRKTFLSFKYNKSTRHQQ